VVSGPSVPAAFDVQVRLAIQHAFLDGRPTPTVASVATDIDADPALVAGAFDRLADAHMIVLVPGTREIMMSAPFAGRPTPFMATVGDRTYYANCIWDALGVSAMLAGAGRPADALVRTTCADCGAPLSVEVRESRVNPDAPDVVTHFAVPAARWWADIGFT
jgi:hypothetical protein